jgi:hypothetical protein
LRIWLTIQNKSDAVGLFRLRTSGSIASGDLKLGLGRYGVISAFGRKEVENFSFTPSLSGTYNENIVVENVLDNINDQNVAVKANVRKAPTFTLDPQLVDFGMVDSEIQPEPIGFTLTNVSKHERTFIIGLKSLPAETKSFCDISLSRDDVGTALSKTEEEEIENIQQKLKIAKRKGKKDKIQKYESRLVELGLPVPQDAEVEVDGDETESTTTASEAESSSKTDGDNSHLPPDTPMLETNGQMNAPEDEDTGGVEYGPKALVSTLTVVLQPNQKNRILVELLLKSPHHEDEVEGGSNNDSIQTKTKEHDARPLGLDLDSIIEVHEKKNADESQSVKVIARQRTLADITSAAMASHNAQPGGVQGNHSSITSGSSSVPSTVLPISQGQSFYTREEQELMNRYRSYCTYAILSRTHSTMRRFTYRFLRRFLLVSTLDFGSLCCSRSSFPTIRLDRRIDTCRLDSGRWLFTPNPRKHTCRSQCSNKLSISSITTPLFG